MNNKKFLVIILALLLALLGAFLMHKSTPIQDLPRMDKETSVEPQKEIIDEAVKPSEIFEETKQIVKPDVKEEFPIIRPTFVPEPEEIVENTAQKEEKTDIIKEANTDVVIITREYKMKSPDKYSFK